MKNKLHNQIKVLSYITSTDRFRLLFLMLIILALYAAIVLGIAKDNFFDSILLPFEFYIFNIFMFALLFLNTLNTCTIFNKNFSFYIMRLKNKANYIKELFKTTIVLNLFFFLLFFIFYFVILIFFKPCNFNIYNYQNYGISNFIYTIFYMGRYIVLSILIMLISASIYIILKEKITMITSAIFMAGFMLPLQSTSLGSSFTIIPWNYFLSLSYSSFMTEVIFSILFMFILGLIVYIMYKISLKSKKMVIT